jgi:aspartate carbamoyltransferase catalytic subunit
MPAGLLGIEALERGEIQAILDRAKDFQPPQGQSFRRLDLLRGKMIVNLFFESSTRTRTSFEIAAKRLGADSISITAAGSSVSKGESLVDTLNTLVAMRPDARTILDQKPALEGLRVAIIGDIAHSRVARSNIYLLSKFGASIVLCGPAPLLPCELAMIAPGVRLTNDIREAITGADVIMMLRVQLERQKEAAFPAGEYFQFYGLHLEHLDLMKPDALVMHPGPINRGREISSEVADSQRSVILNQVENGVAVRMAVLERIVGGGNAEAAH